MTEINNELLNANSFELFEISPSVVIDKKALLNKYRELQKQYHPDNFVNNNQADQALVLSLSAKINDAYHTLTSPLLLVLELLKISGHEIDLNNNSDLSSEFLITQMELHEEIEDASSNKSFLLLDELEKKLNRKQEELLEVIDLAFKQNNLNKMIELARELAFYDKLIKLVAKKIDKLY